MVKMARRSVIKLEGSSLKEFIIRNQIDVENQCKISSREFARTKLTEITESNKIVSMGVLNYQNKILKSYSPYVGEVINEELIYKYAIDNKLIDGVKIDFNTFTNNTTKIKNKLDEIVLQGAIEKEIFKFTISELHTLKYREETCVIATSKDLFNEIKVRLSKKLLKRGV
jgi:hypothetical protein